MAICDQLEDPKLTKKIVKRGVTELVTPGVSFNDEVLEQRKNNFLCGIYLSDKTRGISFLDVSTGEFLVAECNHEYLQKLISGFRPSEIIFQKNKKTDFENAFGSEHYTFRLDEWIFTKDYAEETLNNQFQTKTLKGFGIDNLPKATIAAGAIFHLSLIHI